MPVMLRPKTKATKIAYNILGVPDNIRAKKDKRDRKIDRRLLFEETTRSR